MQKLSFIAYDSADKIVASGEFTGEWIDLQQLVAAIKVLLHPRSPTVRLTFDIGFSVEDQTATVLTAALKRAS